MKTTALCLALSLALGGSAFAAGRAPEGMPDPGIFAPFSGTSGCVPMKAIQAAGAKFMPLKDGSFRFLEGVYIAVPPVSKELPPGDKAVLAIGPMGEVMALFVDGEQTCDRFVLAGFVIDMVAAIESGNHASPDKSGQPL
jgi:hypothetical protein